MLSISLRAQWIHTSSPFQKVNILAADNETLFAETNNGLFVSPNEGTLWVEINSDTLKEAAAAALFPIIESYAPTSVQLDSVLIKLDSSETSIPLDSLLSNIPFFLALIDSISDRGGNIQDTIQISFNLGQTWISFDSLPKGITIYSIAPYSDNYIFIGTNQGVFVTNKSGTEWTQLNSGLTNTNVRALVVYNGIVFAGTENGVFYYLPFAVEPVEWYPFSDGLKNTYVTALICQDSKMLFAGTLGGGVFSCPVLSSTVWSAQNKGLTDLYITTLSLDKNFLFAGTQTSGVWKRYLSELTAVNRISLNGIPNQLYLYQNYPNPFNPKTVIDFTLAKDGLTTLKIYDILGREVETLVNSELRAGVLHQIQFDASNLTSGIYFSCLESGGQKQIKKLILLK